MEFAALDKTVHSPIVCDNACSLGQQGVVAASQLTHDRVLLRRVPQPPASQAAPSVLAPSKSGPGLPDAHCCRQGTCTLPMEARALSARPADASQGSGASPVPILVVYESVVDHHLCVQPSVFADDPGELTVVHVCPVHPVGR